MDTAHICAGTPTVSQFFSIEASTLLTGGSRLDSLEGLGGFMYVNVCHMLPCAMSSSLSPKSWPAQWRLWEKAVSYGLDFILPR